MLLLASCAPRHERAASACPRHPRPGLAARLPGLQRLHHLRGDRAAAAAIQRPVPAAAGPAGRVGGRERVGAVEVGARRQEAASPSAAPARATWARRATRRTHLSAAYPIASSCTRSSPFARVGALPSFVLQSRRTLVGRFAPHGPSHPPALPLAQATLASALWRLSRGSRAGSSGWASRPCGT